jgi:hypothetical protein
MNKIKYLAVLVTSVMPNSTGNFLFQVSVIALSVGLPSWSDSQGACAREPGGQLSDDRRL